MAPGAYELLQELLDTWQPYALVHSWKLPDGFDARVKVMKKEECRIEVDELDHASFTYEYYVNQGSKKGLSNVANVVHSVDAFILREMVRRCNHEGLNVERLHDWVAAELYERAFNGATVQPAVTSEVQYFIDQYERSKQPTAAILPWLSQKELRAIPQGLLADLKRILNKMVSYNGFPVVTIHDSFAAHPNNCNIVRYWYKELLAELADSDILSDIMSQLHGTKGSYTKLSPDLSKYIRQSEYALS